jgi:hypothetical protein
LILQSQKTALSYALQALEAYMNASSDWNFLNHSLLEKVVASISDVTINVQKHALIITTLFTGDDANSKGAIIFMNKKKYSLDFNHLATLLSSNTELEIQISTLRLINNLLRQLTDQERDEGTFQQLLDSIEISKILYVRRSER